MTKQRTLLAGLALVALGLTGSACQDNDQASMAELLDADLRVWMGHDKFGTNRPPTDSTDTVHGWHSRVWVSICQIERVLEAVDPNNPNLDPERVLCYIEGDGNANHGRPPPPPPFT